MNGVKICGRHAEYCSVFLVYLQAVQPERRHLPNVIVLDVNYRGNIYFEIVRPRNARNVKPGENFRPEYNCKGNKNKKTADKFFVYGFQFLKHYLQPSHTLSEKHICFMVEPIMLSAWSYPSWFLFPSNISGLCSSAS